MFSRIFTNGLDHPTRHTHYDGICRNIIRNNSAASDNAIISIVTPGIIMALKPICTLLPIRIFPKRSISDSSEYLWRNTHATVMSHKSNTRCNPDIIADLNQPRFTSKSQPLRISAPPALNPAFGNEQHFSQHYGNDSLISQTMRFLSHIRRIFCSFCRGRRRQSSGQMLLYNE